MLIIIKTKGKVNTFFWALSRYAMKQTEQVQEVYWQGGRGAVQ